jgi:GT2 family glycosyltransferase
MNNTFIIPKSKVFHIIPWDSEKNIGVSYNNSMKIIGTQDWACFLDGDAVHTTTFFGSRIEQVIENNPQYSLFTCYTNRVNCPYQIAPNVDRKSNDQLYHRNFGEDIWNKYKTDVLDITNNQLLSGVLILINKKTWESVGGFKEENMLSVDNDIHKKIQRSGGKVGLMKGIYVQHWYRNDNSKSTQHLLK